MRTSAGSTVTLREAVNYENANGGGSITFAASAFSTAQTIKLSLGALDITSNVAITGPAGGLTISGNSASGVFSVGDGTHSVSVTIADLTLSSGKTSSNGGGVLNNAHSTLTLLGCLISSDTASGPSSDGGGVANFGTMTLNNDTLINDTGSSLGGGLYNAATATITNCTFTDDTSNSGGAMLNTSTGTLTLYNTVMQNDTGYDIINQSGTVTGDYNSSGDGSAPGSDSLRGKNPNYGSLGNHGGPTDTVPLNSGSPVIGKGGAVTTVTSDNGSTIVVGDAATIASTPGSYLIQIDSEQLLVTNVNLSTNTLTVVRGYNGTTQTTHNGSGVYLYVDQRGYAINPTTTTPDIGAYQTQGAAPGTPAVTGVSPSSGSLAGGSVVTITGTNLANATAVDFGALPGTIVSDSGTQIVAITPAESAATVDTTVTTVGWDTSATSAADQFTFAPPSLSSISPASATEGASSFTLTLNGANFDNTATVQWNGASLATTFVNSTELQAVVPAADIAEEGSASITVVSLSGTSNALGFTILDAALTAGTVSASGGVEGVMPTTLSATFTDANVNAPTSDFSGTIDWGDGNPVTNFDSSDVTANGNGSFTVTASYQYAEESGATPYNITVTINDVGGSSTTDTGTTTVADAALTAGTVSASGGVEGVTPTTLSATFTDANLNAPTSDFSGTINWGDGNPVTNFDSSDVTANGNGGFTINASYQYAEESGATPYNITVTINDVGGSTTIDTGTTTVADAPLTAGTIVATAGVEGVTPTNLTATFTDANLNAPASDFSGTIDWGDGNAATPFTAADVTANGNGSYSVSASYQYAEEGSYTISVTINDVGGASLGGTGSLTLYATQESGGSKTGKGGGVGGGATFLSIDPATGEATPIGSLSEAITDGLAYDSSSNAMYVTEQSAAVKGSTLYSVDLSDGTDTFIGNIVAAPATTLSALTLRTWRLTRTTRRFMPLTMAASLVARPVYGASIHRLAPQRWLLRWITVSTRWRSIPPRTLSMAKTTAVTFIRSTQGQAPQPWSAPPTMM